MGGGFFKLESNRKMVHIIVFISALFLSIIVYLTYIQIFKAEEMAQNPYNKDSGPQKIKP